MPKDRPKIVLVSSPPLGAGDVPLEVVPEGEVWRLISSRFVFTTSAAVANRRIALVITSASEAVDRTAPSRDADVAESERIALGAETAMQIPTAATQAASLTRQYSFIAGVGSRADSSFTLGELLTSMPTGIYLPEFWSIGVTVDLIDVGDVFDSVTHLVEKM